MNINAVVSRPEQQQLFPNIRFTCNGFITKWIVGAQTLTSGSRMPELQIWRRNGTTDSYTKTNSSLITPNEIPGSPNVHEFIPATPMQFNTGDIVGVHQPSLTSSNSMHSRFVLYYQENTGPANYRQTTTNPRSSFALSSPDDEYDYPLVSVEISTSAVIGAITHHSAQLNVILPFQILQVHTYQLQVLIVYVCLTKYKPACKNSVLLLLATATKA